MIRLLSGTCHDLEEKRKDWTRLVLDERQHAAYLKVTFPAHALERPVGELPTILLVVQPFHASRGHVRVLTFAPQMGIYELTVPAENMRTISTENSDEL